MRRSIPLAVCAAAALTAAAAAPAGATISKGPATAVNPYVLPTDASSDIKSLLTVGDSVPNTDGGPAYRMVGIPDGLGATPRRRGKFDLFMNHELGATAGIARRHGQKGAFVSKWRLNANTFNVESGKDLINPTVQYWNYDTGAYQTTAPKNFVGTTDYPTGLQYTDAFGRFCSGYLTFPGQFGLRYNPAGDTPGVGYSGQLYLANEEVGNEGRVFAVTTDGDAEQLPRLGLFSWENTIVAPTTKVKTVVMGNEDGPTNGSELWIYVGNKTASGTPAARAGLKNGLSYVIDTVDQTVSNDTQFRAKFGKGTAVPVVLNEVDWNQSGAAQNREAAGEGLGLTRIEDGVFDPRNRNDYWFVTTSGGPAAVDPQGNSISTGGLWKFSFVNVNRPELGGTLTLVLDGSETPKIASPDNLGIDTLGNLMIQEDPGNNAHVSKIWAYNIYSGEIGDVGQFDPALFTPIAPATSPLKTRDEESSGIIDAAPQYGPGTFLFDAQSHNALGGELVEDGQLMLLKVTNWADVYNRPTT